MLRSSRGGGFGRPLHVAAIAFGSVLAAYLGLSYAASGSYRTDGTFPYVGTPASASAPALQVSQPPLALPDGTQATWVPINTNAAFLEPGHRVDVFVTVRVDDQTRVVKLLSSALVVEVNRNTSPGAYQNNDRACLALTAQEAELLERAQSRDCALNLVQRNPKSRAVPTDPSAVAQWFTDTRPVAPPPRAVGR